MGSVLLSAPGLFNYIQSLTVEHSHNLRYALSLPDLMPHLAQSHPVFFQHKIRKLIPPLALEP